MTIDIRFIILIIIAGWFGLLAFLPSYDAQQQCEQQHSAAVCAHTLNR